MSTPETLLVSFVAGLSVAVAMAPGGCRALCFYLDAVGAQRGDRVAEIAARVQLNRLALHQHPFEGLDTETVQGRCAVQQHRVLGDDLFEHA